MKSLLHRFVSDDRGLEMVEYAVMAALIAAGLIAAVTFLRGAISDKFNSLSNTISTAS